jgi:geranylgeranyl reductase family protein
VVSATPPHSPRAFDICIVGAGPAGSTAAYLLAKQGFSVALIDRARFPRDKTCGDGITPRGARVLERIGALGSVSAKGYACRGVDIRGRGPDGATVEFTMRFDRGRSNGPSDLIVLPRLALDDLLLEHALTAGPTYFEATKVVGVESHDTHARVITDSGLAIDAATVVLATGAESQLLRACGLLAKKPAVEHAARIYFDNVEGLTDRVVLFFDGVDLPGYGWIFPTSPTSANIGCGAFAQSAASELENGRAMPQSQRLEALIATHPLLISMLTNAKRSGPMRAYPLRTDFHRDFAGRGRLLVIGEAAGLVNPITGEGIDYALESAEFLAAALSKGWPRQQRRIANDGSESVLPLDMATATRLTEDYRRRLSRRFTRRFSLYRAVQRHALAPARTPSLLTQVADAPALQRLVVDGLFGRAKPAHLLRPTTLWQIARLFTRAKRRAKPRASATPL